MSKRLLGDILKSYDFAKENMQRRKVAGLMRRDENPEVIKRRVMDDIDKLLNAGVRGSEIMMVAAFTIHEWGDVKLKEARDRQRGG